MPHDTVTPKRTQSELWPSLSLILIATILCGLSGAAVAGLMHITGLADHMAPRTGAQNLWLLYGAHTLYAAFIGALGVIVWLQKESRTDHEHRRIQQPYLDAGFTPQQSRMLAKLEVKQREHNHFSDRCRQPATPRRSPPPEDTA